MCPWICSIQCVLFVLGHLPRVHGYVPYSVLCLFQGIYRVSVDMFHTVCCVWSRASTECFRGYVPYSVLCLFQGIYRVSMDMFLIVCCVCSRASTACPWICSIQCVVFVPGHLPSVSVDMFHTVCCVWSRASTECFRGYVPYSVLCLFQGIYRVSMDMFLIVCCVCSRASTACPWICSIQCVVFVPGHLPRVRGYVPYSVLCLFQGIYRVSVDMFHTVCCVCSRASTECPWICSI